MFVFVFGIPVFISVRLKNVKVKTLGMTIQVQVSDTRRLFDLTGTGMWTIFYSQVTPVPNPN
jgi:hypothetical protein